MSAHQEFPVSVTINGQTYTAKRVVTGTKKLRQYVEFRGHIEHDSTAYCPHNAGQMGPVAELILWQALTRGWLGQSPLAPPEPPA
jgi:hypothetical protein